MSKLDAVRALREARYAETQTRAGSAAKAAPKPAASTATKAAKKTVTRTAAKQTAPEPEATDDELCGHRNIGGRTCTRERGHAAKTHRYS